MARNYEPDLFRARYRPHKGSKLDIQLLQQDECFGRMTIEAAEELSETLTAAIRSAKNDLNRPRPPAYADRHPGHIDNYLAAEGLLPHALPKLATVEDLATLLNMSKAGVYALLHKVPKDIVVRLGRRVRVKEKELLEWINAGGHQQG